MLSTKGLVHMRSVADVLAEELVAFGVKVVFGLPGGENTEVLDAIRRHGIDFVLVHNESSAVFMADANARLTGIPGVCLTTLGPGATNACVGVAHAFLDRSPILAITASSDVDLIGRHTHQVLDLQSLFAPITKLTVDLTSEQPASTIRHALALTTNGRPGPVHLGISSKVAALPASGQERAVSLQPSRPPAVDPSAMKQAQAMLASARRPLLVCGLGLEPESPYAVLRLLAESLDAPVIVTPKAKGAIPDDHPLSVGTVGLTRTDPVYGILDEADCVVAVGFDVVELVKPWETAAPLLWIARWPNEDPAIPAQVELVGQIGPMLRHLVDAIGPVQPGWGRSRVKRFRTQLDQVVPPTPSVGRINPQSVLAAVRASTSRDILITTDVGSHKILTALSWPAYAPNRYLLSNGLSAMGYGLASAIGAAYTTKQSVIAITGDAGLAMVIGELGLARRLGLSVIVVVMNDNALDLIRSAQVRNGKPTYGTEFVNPDFALIAAAYDIDYYRAATEEDVTLAITDALAAGMTALVDAFIDPRGYPTMPAARPMHQSHTEDL